MIDPLSLTQIQYELAMSVGTSLDMEEMMKSALGAFLRKLGGTAIGVHWLPGWNGEPTTAPITFPRGAIRAAAYAQATEHLPTAVDKEGWRKLRGALPQQGGTETSGFFHILELPGIGVLILTRQAGPLEPVIVDALQPLLARLVNACLACRQNEELAEAHQESIRTNRTLTHVRHKLEELANRNQAILDAIPDWMFVLNREGHIQDYKLNDSTAAGRFVMNLLHEGNSIDEILYDTLARQTHQAIQQALRSGKLQTIETNFDFGEGGIVEMEARLVVSGPDEVLAIVQDISERKRLSARLEDLARFPAESPNPVMRIGRDGQVLFANQTSQPILAAWEQNGQVRVPNDCLDTLGQAIANSTTTELEKEIGERVYLLTVAPVVNAEYVNLYAQDITERYRSEEVLAQERNLLRTFIDNLPDQVYVKDMESRFLLNNPAVLWALGAESDEEVVGKTDFDFHSPELAAEFFADEQRILAGGQPVLNKEERIVASDGQEYWLASTKVPLYDQKQEIVGLIGINRNITEAKQAADALRQAAAQNQLLAQAMEAASDGIIITDAHQPDNPVIYANPAFSRITGYSNEDIVGRNCRFLQGPETDQEQLNQLRQAIREKRSTAVTLLNYRKDGSPFLNELTISPVFSTEGALTHFVGIQTDISERRKMADTLKAVLDTVGEGIVSADDNGMIVMVNPEIQRIFGYQTEELMGQSLVMLMPADYRDAHQAGMARYLASGIPHVLGKRLELEGLRKNGQVFPLEIYISETRIAEQHLFTASIRDITQRKEYDRMRDDFVSTVSHELRTPLASVMGWTETLLSEKPGPLTDLQKRFLGIVYDSSGRLNRLIEEILTVSRIQRGTLQLNRKEFSPRESMAGVGEMLKSVAEPKGIAVDYQEHWPPNVRLLGDPDRIEQVLTNLISNAIKFSPGGGTVTVESTEAEGCWRVTVRDQGIGIPAAELPQLFERFYRASNANEAQIQGTGLGLYVCKAIVEGHGGEIGVESVQDEGTTVWFTLPA